MASGPQGEPTLRDLFARIIDDVANLVRAELNLYRQTAYRRAMRARAGAIALASGAAIVTAGLIALMLGIVLGLATLIGPIAAGVAVAVASGVVGYVLIRFGIAEIAKLALESDVKDHEAVVERVL